MQLLDLNDIVMFVEQNIGAFHARRLKSLENLKLEELLKRKNHYLFKAKNVLTAHDLIKALLDAHLSSQEETIFGDFLEQLAIYICEKVYSGIKSPAQGIDLQFTKDGTVYIVSIKSGPNWGNSGQLREMMNNFKKATRILRTNNPNVIVVAVNGCCTGRDTKPHKVRDDGEYEKLCGQAFWEFISGNPDLYTEIIEPLGHRAKEYNDSFQIAYARIINRFEQEFIQEFCHDGIINWAALVQLNACKERLPRKAHQPGKVKIRRKD